VILFAINPSPVHTVRMRMRAWRRRLVLVSVLLALAAPRCASIPARRHLLIVVDGLRPDYVTSDMMPNL